MIVVQKESLGLHRSSQSFLTKRKKFHCPPWALADLQMSVFIDHLLTSNPPFSPFP